MFCLAMDMKSLVVYGRQKYICMDANMVKIEPQSGGLAKLFVTVAHVFGWDLIGEAKRVKAKAFTAILEAEAAREVARINAESDFELQNYLLARELRKMDNAKSVVEVAGRLLSDEEPVSSEPVKQDWVNRYISIVEGISEESLRELWGRILAGEVRHPSSYSLRTLDVLRNVTKEEAELFAKSTMFRVKVDYVWTDDSVLSFHEVILLTESGFLSSEDLAEEIEVKAHDVCEVVLDRDTLLLLVNDSDDAIACSIDIKKISTAGREILSITSTNEGDKEHFYRSMAMFFKDKGISRVYKHQIVDYDNDILYDTEEGVEIIS